MPATVAKRVELLDITEPQSGLLLHPGAQPDLEGAMGDGIERTERKPGQLVVAARGEDSWLVAVDRDDRRGQADLDRLQRRFTHSRSMRKGRPSATSAPGPIRSSACSIRPSRPSALSARLTISRL